MGRKDYSAVGLLPHIKPAVLHLSMLFHQRLIAQIKLQMLLLQLADRIQDALFQSLHPLIAATVIADPGGGLRMHEQDVRPAFPFCQDHPDSGHRIHKCTVILPPGLLIIDRRRIISFADPPQRISLQMLAERCNASDHLPLCDPFEFRKAHIVTAQRKGLRQYLFLPGLSACACQLMHGETGEYISAQPVHSRYVQIFIMRHHRTVAGKL